MVMVLDAYTFVTAAQKWELFKPQTWVITNSMQSGCGKIPKKHEYKVCRLVILKDSIEITTAMLFDNLQTLEQIDIRVRINHPRCGDMMVELVPTVLKCSRWNTTRQRLGSLDGGSDYQTLVRICIRLGGIPMFSNLNLVCDAGMKILSGTGPLKRRSSSHYWSMMFYPRQMYYLALYLTTPILR